MSRRCKVTGKKGLVGNNVSHSKRRTKRVQEVNLQWKRFWIPEEKRFVRLRVATSTLRTIAKNGVSSVLRKAGLIKTSTAKKNKVSKATKKD